MQVVLVIFPFALLGYSSFSGTGLEEAMRADPGFVVSFIAAMAQPLAAWILRFAYRHYADGDGGYAVGNLIGLLCAEAFLQNVVGLAGFALILWRMWGKTQGDSPSGASVAASAACSWTYRAPSRCLPSV